jgi:hypothetical protein
VIIVCYLVYGFVVYSQQGAYTVMPANQGISHYGFQTATNTLNLFSALIAAGLYGNIGLKVIYQSVIVDQLNGPALTSSTGKYVWCVLVLMYWTTAFAICSAIPQLSNISALVGALCIMNFSYTFPFLMQLGLDWQSSDEAWWRKCIAPKNAFHGILVLGSLACVALGTYTAVHDIVAVSSKGGHGSPFSCTSPI